MHDLLRASTSSVRQLAAALTFSGCLFAGSAFAQSTSGSITGQAVAGSTIVIVNQDSGLKRSVTVDKDGRYRFAALPPGRYTVGVEGDEANAKHDVDVTTSAAADVSFASTSAQHLETITVSGRSLAAIDVNSVESGTSFSAAQLQSLPVPRDIGRVALLSPGTVATDARIVGASNQFIPSFGGASAAENSYYVNGFNVTNQFDALGYSEVPYPAIGSLDLKEGGYGAEYGYSTGGVLSVNTQRGTNEWKGGASVVWKPPGLEETVPNIYRNNGNLYQTNDRNKDSDTVVAAWLGGPIIKDTLFVYLILQQERQYTDFYPSTGLANAGATRTGQRNPYWLAKVDWNINDSNLLEYTGFNDTQHQRQDVYDAIYADNGSVSRQNYYGSIFSQNGGQLNILKYTSFITDSVTLTAQYGKMDYKRENFAAAANGTIETYNGVVGDFNQPGCPSISDLRDGVAAGTEAPYPTCGFAGSLSTPNGGDTKKQGNIDLEWKVGSHDLKGGYSTTKFSTDTGSSYEGGAQYTYATDPTLGDYVEQVLFQTGAKVAIDQKAYYLEDNWHITDRLLAYIGVRNDGFDNKNGLGQSYVKQDDIWQPRLGFAWDIAGDSSMKLFGNAGRYSLPIASNVALRGSAASIYRIQDFFYGAVDPVTGAPLNLTPGVGLPQQDPYYINGETGQTPDPRSVADRDLKPYEQDEYILGFQTKLSDAWTVGVKGIHRKLVNAIDDTCDWRPFQKYGQALGLDVGDYPPGTTPGCFLFNPGRGLNVDLDLTGNGTLTPVHLTAGDLGEPKARRTYDAIEFSFERAWDDKWYLSGSYTWSKNKGNTEGLVKSDIGQTDTGTTQDFDYPELMQNSYGYLPNDRRHQFKVYGAYKPWTEWTFGSNLQVASGRPENCFGVFPNSDTADYIAYGNSYFYCQGNATPRGSVGRTPWNWTIGLNVSYQPEWIKGLNFQVDVLNLFNNSKPLVLREFGEDGAGNSLAGSTYLIPRQFQTPRYVRFQAQYDFTL